MISLEEALEKTLALLTPVDAETVDLARAGGRVLAAPVVAMRDQPPFAAAAMDGYAVRAADAALGAELRVVAEIPAGGLWDGALGPGAAARIFTGAPVPEGADTILIQENARRDGDVVVVRQPPPPGAHLRQAGCDFQAGARLDPPRRLSPQDIALIAAMNAPTVEARRKPVVHLIATGDELVWPGESPEPGQIVCSNTFGLAALLTAQGAAPVLQPIAHDDPAALIAALNRAEGADLIVTTGGVSVGDRDLVTRVLGRAGLDLSFHKVAIRPGKPLMAGRMRGTATIGLPGNPASSLVLGHLILRPAVDALLGLPAGPLPRETVRLGCATGGNGPRAHFMRARLESGPDGPLAFPFPSQDSAMLWPLSAADALAILPPNAPPCAAGDAIKIVRLNMVP